MTAYAQNCSDRIVARSPTPTTIQSHLVVVPPVAVILASPAKPTYRAILVQRSNTVFKPAVAIGSKLHVAVSAALILRQVVRVATSLHVSTGVRLTPALKMGLAFMVADAIELQAIEAIKALLGQRVASAVVLAAHGRQAWAKAVSDRLRAGASLSQTYTAMLAEADEIEFHSAEHVRMVCLVAWDDALDISDDVASIARLHALAQDVLDFAIQTIQPNGTTSTWSINTRTGAVTEYQNYEFDSFVKLDDGTYVGAGSDGNLYQLHGNSDNGTAIVADIVGGLLDMGGSRWTGLKAVYLGARAAGQFYLKLTTNNDVTRTYEVSVKPLKTARYDIGKGLRSRYIQWELISTGQDFDLTSIEFVPLVMTRRV